MIECKSTYHEISGPDSVRLVNYWTEELLIDRIKKRFTEGAVIWIVKCDGNVAGYGWSIRGKMVSQYFLPLTPHDAVLFDYVIFDEFRGRGLYPLLINYMFSQLKIAGVKRAFGHSYAWNESSIHGLSKTFFRKFSLARQFHIFGRDITIWY
ncbi:MAG: N-acetyltransferase family protein [Syntrophales bacterium]